MAEDCVDRDAPFPTVPETNSNNLLGRLQNTLSVLSLAGYFGVLLAVTGAQRWNVFVRWRGHWMREGALELYRAAVFLLIVFAAVRRSIWVSQTGVYPVLEAIVWALFTTVPLLLLLAFPHLFTVHHEAIKLFLEMRASAGMGQADTLQRSFTRASLSLSRSQPFAANAALPVEPRPCDERAVVCLANKHALGCFCGCLIAWVWPTVSRVSSILEGRPPDDCRFDEGMYERFGGTYTGLLCVGIFFQITVVGTFFIYLVFVLNLQMSNLSFTREYLHEQFSVEGKATLACVKKWIVQCNSHFDATRTLMLSLVTALFVSAGQFSLAYVGILVLEDGSYPELSFFYYPCFSFLAISIVFSATVKYYRKRFWLRLVLQTMLTDTDMQEVALHAGPRSLSVFSSSTVRLPDAQLKSEIELEHLRESSQPSLQTDSVAVLARALLSRDHVFNWKELFRVYLRILTTAVTTAFVAFLLVVIGFFWVYPSCLEKVGSCCLGWCLTGVKDGQKFMYSECSAEQTVATKIGVVLWHFMVPFFIVFPWIWCTMPRDRVWPVCRRELLLCFVSLVIVAVSVLVFNSEEKTWGGLQIGSSMSRVCLIAIFVDWNICMWRDARTKQAAGYFFFYWVVLVQAGTYLVYILAVDSFIKSSEDARVLMVLAIPFLRVLLVLVNNIVDVKGWSEGLRNRHTFTVLIQLNEGLLTRVLLLILRRFSDQVNTAVIFAAAEVFVHNSSSAPRMLFYRWRGNSMERTLAKADKTYQTDDRRRHIISSMVLYFFLHALSSDANAQVMEVTCILVACPIAILAKYVYSLDFLKVPQMVSAMFVQLTFEFFSDVISLFFLENFHEKGVFSYWTAANAKRDIAVLLFMVTLVVTYITVAYFDLFTNANLE